MEKVLELCRCVERVRDTQGRGRSVVFTNGCFDLLHVGHVRYLTAARGYGDFLVVGLNSDRSVVSVKGPLRPIVCQQERAEVLAALECVDCVTIFDEPDPYRLIDRLRPQILVKGADWAEGAIVGADLVKRSGGRVVRIPVSEGKSTSELVRRIVKRYGRLSSAQVLP